ncbi:MAG: BON domain-containing protein [Acidobacteriota bacterium]|nr:BON domain-containing protein [Acidobacteriota bacterium]MDE2965582.1 BON domain-containing protein [Acidobacteriota bacterium]
MRQSSAFVGLAVAAALLWRVGVGQALPQQPVRAELVGKIQKVLAELPYYGMFDHLVFELEDDRVTLGGYAFRPLLKDWAEREVSRVAGVDKVDNQIEVLPDSANDDRIRMAAFRAIYKDQGLAGYGFGGETWRAFTRNEHEILYFEREPLGIYPIHIIVKHGNVILVGLVASQEDKTLAGVKANGVSGVFSVTNNLRVDTRMQSP